MGRTLVPLLLAAMAAVCAVALWRLLLALRRRREPRRGEDALQYEIWYVLRQKDAAAADRFLTQLWERMRAERARAAAPAVDRQALLETQVAEMAGAMEALRRAHAGESALPPALAALEDKVKQLCGDSAALHPGGAT